MSLKSILESIISQIHYPPAHLPFHKAIVDEYEALTERVVALEAKVREMTEPTHPVELTPVPPFLTEQVTVFGEGGDPEGSEIDTQDHPDELDEPVPSPSMPVDTSVDTQEQAPIVGETTAADQELKPFPDLLPASPDPESAAPTTSE